MHPQQIRDHARKQPFEPFRIHMSDGSSYDIYHPEMAIVTARAVGIGVHSTDDLEDVPDRLVQLDPLHVTRIEPLSGNQRNGQQRE